MAVDKSAERVRRMFAEIAGRYDFLNHLLSLNVDRYWRWQTVRLLRPAPGKPILDVCCGTGDLSLAFARKAKTNDFVMGADFCHEMLKLAKQKSASRQRGPMITFLEADTQHLPYPNETFQIVSVAFGLRNVADTDRGLQEMTRVCATGGKVAVLEFSEPTFPPVRAVYGWYFRNVLPRLGQWFAKNQSDAYNYLPSSVGEFPSGEALATRMRQNGLREVTFRRFTCGIATLYIGVK